MRQCTLIYGATNRDYHIDVIYSESILLHLSGMCAVQIGE